MNPYISAKVPKKTREEILSHPKASGAVEGLKKYLIGLDDTTMDSGHFARSLFVIGSFTNPEECNDYSDIDLIVLIPLVLYKNLPVRQQIEKRLHDLETEIQEKYPSHTDLHLWHKPIEWYENYRPVNEIGGFFGMLRSYKYGKSNEDHFTSSTPYDLLALDGWSGLANDVLMHYECATAIVLEGENVFANLQLPEKLSETEWFELALVASRDLASGFSNRADGWGLVHSKNDKGNELILRGERQIAKAVLRMFYSLAIWETGQPLNTYKAIRDWALERYKSDARMVELAENAYETKALLKRTLVTSTSNLWPFASLSSETSAVAPIANLFSLPTRMKSKTIYLMQGFVQAPFKPGVREFYWERTLPGVIKLLVDRDIDPRILSVFVPEIRDYLLRDLSYLKERGISQEQISNSEIIAQAITILERYIWFLLNYNAQGGSAYDAFQFYHVYGKERLSRIDSLAQDILYGENKLFEQAITREAHDWIETETIEVIGILANALAHYGTDPLVPSDNDLAERAIILCPKMASALANKRFAKQYDSLVYQYMLILGQLWKARLRSSKARFVFKRAVSWYEQAIRLNPEREDAYYYLGDLYASYGWFRKAKKAFLQALQVDPKSARSLALYVDLHYMGPLVWSTRDAIRTCKELLNINGAAGLGLVKLTFPHGWNSNTPETQAWVDEVLGTEWEKHFNLFKNWNTGLVQALAFKSQGMKAVLNSLDSRK